MIIREHTGWNLIAYVEFRRRGYIDDLGRVVVDVNNGDPYLGCVL